ncbi:TPA: CHAP domain-containing protein [Streptococcus suis]|nr:CHAP domain-containing protein [Streptococcus suis]HEM6052998.1 CHAP domain-containing protein [Streptococcus suis]
MKKKKNKLKKKWLFLFFLPILFPIFFLFFIIFIISGPQSMESSRSSSGGGGVYAEHWSTGDPYSHNLFVQRFGITAEQLDGYLDSTGISYDKNRINGNVLLHWERISGIDVRALVAIAQMESSFGTAGVATMPGANMFGFGAFDSDPENATSFSDEVAVVGLANQTIKANKNETFQIQDEKAQKFALGVLNVAIDGGVYFTDTSGSGRVRANVMLKLDNWIDVHGGTPPPPASVIDPVTGNGSSNPGVLSSEVPAGYTLDKSINTVGYIAQSYPWGQCTWFVFNRAKEFGISFDPYMGNGADWKTKPGYSTTNTPTKHSAVSFSPGESMSDPTYGHVAFVEEVKADGSVLISESNVQGLGVINYRILDAASAKTFTYVIGK